MKDYRMLTECLAVYAAACTLKTTILLGTNMYRIGEQRMLRRTCVYAQSRESVHFSYTQNMEAYKGLGHN